MSPEIDANTILSGLAVLGTVTTIYLSVRYERRRRREREADRKIAKEQLDLARQEALRNPILEVGDVSLTVAEGTKAVAKVRAAKGKRRELEEDLEANPPDSPLEGMKRQTEYMRGNDIRHAAYDGPYPDLMLTFELRNLGKKSAHEISVTVWFDSDFLKPIEFPRLDGKVRTRNRASFDLGKLPPRIRVREKHSR